jgi:hypothetical protein
MSVLRVTSAGGVQPVPVMAKAIEVAEDVFGRLNTALSWTFEVEFVRVVEAFDDAAEVIANVLDVNGDDVGRAIVWLDRDSDLDPSEVHLRLDVDGNGNGNGGQVLSQAVWDRFTCSAGSEHETGNGVHWCEGDCGAEAAAAAAAEIAAKVALEDHVQAVARNLGAKAAGVIFPEKDTDR